MPLPETGTIVPAEVPGQSQGITAVPGPISPIEAVRQEAVLTEVLHQGRVLTGVVAVVLVQAEALTGQLHRDDPVTQDPRLHPEVQGPTEAREEQVRHEVRATEVPEAVPGVRVVTEVPEGLPGVLEVIEVPAVVHDLRAADLQVAGLQAEGSNKSIISNYFQ